MARLIMNSNVAENRGTVVLFKVTRSITYLSYLSAKATAETTHTSHTFIMPL